MKTLIVGCGYVGKALAEYWKPTKRDVVATTTRQERVDELLQVADEVLVVSAENVDVMKKALQGVESVVVCLAAQRKRSYEQTYLHTAQAITQAIQETPSVKQLVYTSATSVYGSCDGQWVTETSELTPTKANGQVLCDAEKVYFNDLPESVQVTVLRLGGIYGPGREHRQRAQRMAGTVCAGSGESYCNWVHQEDIVRAIDWVLTHEHQGVFNLCSEDHPKRSELYGALLAEMQLDPVIWDPKQMTTHAGNKRVSSEKIAALGFKFWHSCMGPEASLHYSLYLPEFSLSSASEMGRLYREVGVHSFLDAVHWTHGLPYGRAGKRASYQSIFKERCGTCSTKHAALAALAAEHGFSVALKMGICDWKVPVDSSLGKALQNVGLDSFPEAHCFLHWQDHESDLTHGKNSPKLNLEMREVCSLLPQQIGSDKVERHRAYLSYFLKEKGVSDSLLESLWEFREEWITSQS